MNDPYLTDHYHPLALASSAILTALRQDESSPQGDLYKRIVTPGSSNGHYFSSVNGGEGGKQQQRNTTSEDDRQPQPMRITSAASPTSHLIHSHSLPLPTPIATALQTTQISHFMGLYTEANLVWVACDSVLFLWRHHGSSSSSSSYGGYESDAAAGGGGGGSSMWGGVPSLPRRMSEDVCSFRVPSGQCIVGVGVVRPKRGVFKPSVQHCVILSTPSEVLLCALDNSTQGLRLVPTRFILPTDNVPMLSIRGTKNGRIFMGGHDGNLYEMNYEHSNNGHLVDYAPRDIEEVIDNYFDGDGELMSLDVKSSGKGVLSGGKRVLSALTFGGLDGSDHTRRRKCRKINHSSVAGGAVSGIPGISGVVKAAAGIFGSSMEAAARKGGAIVSLVIDEERMCLYTLGANGIICTYDLMDTAKSKENNSPPRLASVLDCVATAKLYLDWVSTGRTYPPSTNHTTELGTITFPGGTDSAQAGVGGMPGAREILKRHNQEARLGNNPAASQLNPREITNSAGILHPVSIHLVAGEESKSLTLVAVTGGGLRYYLSSLSSSSISSAHASQGSFHYASRGNDSKLTRVRPSKKMTFCHIRAPPPYTSSDGSNDGLKIEVAPSTTDMLRSGSGPGIPPGIHNSPIPAGATADGKKGDVVRSFYGKDIFVLALDVEKGKRSSRNNGADFLSQGLGEKKKATAGNALVVALSDAATRVTGTDSNTTSTAITIHNGHSNDSSRSTSGGISEVTILPMSGNEGASSPVLPGGTTFDVSSQSNRQSSVVSLFVNSETPSDSELEIGLMPTFTPPKTRPGKINPSPGASSAITVASTQGRGVISSALSTLSNFLRGQGYGYQVSTVSGTSDGLRPTSTFRVSRRHGCDSTGFSSSSAEVVTRQGSRVNTPRSNTPKSARLPSWLMAPSAAPMSFQSSMHLTPPGTDSVLVLNAGGLHFFTNSSLLNNLASVLLRASNIANDESVRNFFTSYGYAEGCAMCFALVTSSSSNASLRTKAEQAILTHAHTPSMTLIGSGDGQDPLSAYKFQPSSLYEGLVKASSRLLRPLWYKVAAVVTEGRPVPTKHSLYSNYYAAVPAKVELLLDDATLDEIRRPLLLLQELMKKTFVRVVESVPGATTPHADSMDIDEDLNQGGLITRAIQNQARLAQRGASSNQPHDLTADELRKVAFQREDRNIHSLYRLWSRSIQLLDLLRYLKQAHMTPALPDVQWGLLHGVTFCQLVTTLEGQQRVETLLNALFSQSESNLVSDLSTEGDSLAERLSRQCYLYFSSASRLTYLGFKSARDALSRSVVSNQRELLSNKAASYLRAAARHWHDPALVIGRLAVNGSDSWQGIAKTTIESESPLALAADELMKLENAQGVADVCLICAANFGGAKVPRNERKELGETPIEGMFDWERGLYQQPPVDKSSDNLGAQPSSSRSIVVSGIKATPSDALKACHSILFYYITKLLGEGGEVNQRLAEELLEVCASSSDAKFLHSLYDLLAKNHGDILVRIDSSTLENWLVKEKKDVNLLSEYYAFHGRNILAGDVTRKVALDESEKTPLNQRIKYLARALNAFSAALQQPAATGQVSDLKDRITQIKEQLEVAAIQQNILTIMEQSQNTNLDEEKMDKLSFSLVSVSDLYNEYAAPFTLFDICLKIINTCHQNDSGNIATLWMSILCEELLPCQTHCQAAFEFLSQLKGSSLIQEDIVFGECSDDAIQQFDNGSWIPRLQARVIEVGKNLYGNDSNYTFPLDLLLETLEGLRQTQLQASNSNEASHPWPAQIMLDIEVPYYEIFSTYEGLRLQNMATIGCNTSTSQLQHFLCIIDLLEQWVAKALSNDEFSPSNSTDNGASMQLMRAINRDGLLTHLDRLKFAIEDMNDGESQSVEQIHSRLSDVQNTLQRNFI